jgi:hypothetical protein
MKIELKELTVRDLVDGYEDNEEEGVVGYGGKLDIRPPYQREFIYKDKQRDEVIRTINSGFPLNVMYWADQGDTTFEVIDGQQRTISVCQYVNGDFSLDGRYFDNLRGDEQEKILSYELMVYTCSGTETEKLAWFETVNIAGEKLTQQELLNASYPGPWLSDAKRYFSKTGCPAYGLGSDYMKGSPIRQEFLETVLLWVSDGEIQEHMAKHQHKPDAKKLWLYFQSVINWVEATFPVKRREMKGVPWGPLYNEFKDQELNSTKLEEQVSALMEDEDVTRKPGIYSYVLNGKAKELNIRAFSTNQKREAYERQKGVCPICKKKFELDEMEADHITPWHEGGKTDAANCQMLCREDNRTKAGT